jgi:hypothetical protein
MAAHEFLFGPQPIFNGLAVLSAARFVQTTETLRLRSRQHRLPYVIGHVRRPT